MPMLQGETSEFSSRISLRNAFCDEIFHHNRPHNDLRFLSKLILGHHCYQRAVLMHVRVLENYAGVLWEEYCENM